MKTITIRNYKTGFTSFFQSNDESFIENETARITLIENLFKPQREIVALSEAYDEADVLSTRSEEIDGVTTDYVTLKAEYIVEIEDITESYNREKQIAEDIALGENIENVCKKIFRILNGYLDRKKFSKEQEDIFDLSFAKIFTAIDRMKVKKIRKLVDDLVVDGEIITDKLKENCLSILTKNNF
jgi:hypothetical protein